MTLAFASRTIGGLIASPGRRQFHQLLFCSVVHSFRWRLHTMMNDVATKLRCLCLCKVEMSLGGIRWEREPAPRRPPYRSGAGLGGGFRLRFGGFSDLQSAVL